VDRIEKRRPEERRYTFNHYIPAIYADRSYWTMRPVMSETMEFVAFMSPHFIKMSALT